MGQDYFSLITIIAVAARDTVRAVSAIFHHRTSTVPSNLLNCVPSRDALCLDGCYSDCAIA